VIDISILENEEDNEDSMGNDIDEHTMSLYKRLKKKVKGIEKETESEESTANKLKADLKDQIMKKMSKYRLECYNMSWEQWLDNHGNELYHNSKKKSKINYSRTRLLKDPLYLSKIFDVTKWWRVKELMYPELGTAASLILGINLRIKYSRNTY
jgi:hypothetical protein